MLNKITSVKTKSAAQNLPFDVWVERITLNQLTHDILKSIPCGIIAFDAKGKIIADNNKHWLINATVPNSRSLKGISKLTPDDSLMTLLDDFIKLPVIKETGVEKKIKELLIGKPFEMILPKCRNVLNKTLVVHLTGIPLNNSSGNIVGGLLMFDDVSRYLGLDNRLKIQKQFYTDQSDDLSNYQIFHSNENKVVTTNPIFQKEIEKLNILQELVKGIGEELHNPISEIRKSVAILNASINRSSQFGLDLNIESTHCAERNSHLTNKIQQSLCIISQEIEATNKIINDLIEFVQMPSPEKTKVTLHEAIDDALQSLPISIPPTVKIIIDFPKFLPCLYVDRHQIKQAFGNIITHSVAGMLSGGKLVFSAKTEEVTPGAKSGKNLVLTISDTGIGIPIQKYPKIFHTLFTRKTRGIDMGLSVARYLVMINNGKINMKITPGIGSSSIISLPVINESLNPSEL